MVPEKSSRYSAIGILSVSHFLNDLYGNYLPQMLPFLVVLHSDFSVTRAAILVAAFTITSSFAQPVFGYIVDSRGQRWLVHVGTLWMAACLGLTGLVHENYPLLVLLAGLAGLGTSAFHPQASTMVNVLSGDRKAVLLSAFVACGNFGFAFGPLLLVPLFQAFGLGATTFTILPGILVALLLYFYAPRTEVSKGPAVPVSEVPEIPPRRCKGAQRHHRRHRAPGPRLHRDAHPPSPVLQGEESLEHRGKPSRDDHAGRRSGGRGAGRFHLGLLRPERGSSSARSFSRRRSSSPFFIPRDP